MARRPKKLASEWVKPSVLKDKYSLGDDHLRRLREDGTLKPKIHWLNVGRRGAGRPTYRYNLAECERVLAVAAEER